jgi:DNA repair exonuclease SbcCD ATPase subunit
MRVTYIKLYKYKRFALSHKDVFEHRFEKKLTMILGPNGAGKSSLMGELSPLPPSKDDFYKGGFKQIDIEHNGKNYKLLSDFTDSTPKYFFYVDEENLNASHIVSTQRELAFQHFGLVPVVQDLLSGAENFTEMSLLNRKKLINAFTHLNIDAILENYNDLKDQLKNQEFLLKNTTSLLMTEKQKLSDTTRVQMLEQQKSQCRQMLEQLLQFRTEVHQYHRSGDLVAVQTAFKARQSHWKDVYSSGYTYLTSYPYERLPELRDAALTAISQIQTQMQGCYTRIEQLDQQIDAIRLLQVQDARDLQMHFQHLVLEEARTRASLKYLTEEDFSEQTHAQVLVLEHSLPEVAHCLPLNPDKQLGKAQYQQLTLERVELVTALNRLLQQEIHDEKTRQELLEHANYECPNCQHSWLPHEVQSKLKTVEQSLIQTKERKAQLQLQAQELATPIAQQEAYLEVFSQFVNIFNATKHTLERFWSAVLNEEVHYKDPVKMVSMLRQLQNDTAGCTRLQEIRADLKSVTQKLSVLKEIGDQSLQDLIAQRDRVEEEIEGCHSRHEKEQRNLSDYDTAKHYYQRLAELGRLLEKARQAVYTEHLHQTVFGLVQETDDELSKLKVQMIEIDKELTSHHLVEKMVASYESQITSIQEDVKVLTILTDELSPKNGFIAKSISHFLNVIIGSINQVIAGVWDYKMQLKVINVEEDALNYKFKVVVEDRLEVDDISKVSGGMKEIINLALKITLFKLLRLEHFPMSLDEYGLKLDATHRARIADIIFKMIGSQTYSQIFLITHLDLAYTDFKDTETIELTA